MGMLDVFKTVAETKELHVDPYLRSHYYKTNYQKAKDAVLLHAKELKLDVRHVDDVHKELFLQGPRHHVICSIVQVSPIETSVDFKVEVYGLLGMNKPKNIILGFYRYLDKELPFKGTSLHP